MAVPTALRGSTNFIWDVSKPLGQGATSVVYSGRNKRSGDAVAVKVFNDSSFQRPAEVQLREYEVMKKLNHESIVKLLAVEEEQGTYRKVLVMELCPHGSLFTMLEESENGFGLCEQEFLTVLKHVSLGMKHLRDLDIIHRDIKPGNILRLIGEDGRSVFKLTDFGAARELQDEERFTSLYGTEEYLHPDMYEKAVLRRGFGQRFSGNIDLWSLGVTVYHTATGSLPFRPYGGRRNRETMYDITTKKEYGVISGVQKCEGGSIEWSRELPATSRLSNGLKLLLTPILAGLLERHPERAMHFDQFFHQSEILTSKLSLNVFCPSLCSRIKVYLDKSNVYSKLQEKIAEQTDIPASDQLILFEGQQLTQQVDTLTPVHSYPHDISPENPLIIYNKSDDHLCYCKPVKGSFPSLHNTGYLDVEYSMSKKCAIVVCSIVRAVETCVQRNALIQSAVKQFSLELNSRVQNINHITNSLFSFCRVTQQWHENFIRLQGQQLRTLQLLLNSGISGNSIQTLLSQLQETLRTSQADCQARALRVQQNLDQASKSLDMVKELQHKVNRWRHNEKPLKDEKWCERMKVVSDRSKTIMCKFREDKSKRVLNFNEEQIHKIDRASLNEMCSKATSILETVDERVKLLAGSYKQWYSWAYQCRQHCQKLEAKLKELSDQQSKFITSLNTFCHKYQQLVEDRIHRMEQESGIADVSFDQYDNIINFDAHNNIDINCKESDKAVDVLECLKTSRISLEEVVNLVQENNSLLHSFQSLSSGGEQTWTQPDIT